MKHFALLPLIAGGFLTLALGACSQPGGDVGSTIAERSDLTQFHHALVETGVMSELESGHYTVFAPTDAAFAAINRTQYPCFYDERCRDARAALLRRHIVPGNEHLTDTLRDKAALATLGDRPLRIATTGSGGRELDNIRHYRVDGRKVLSETHIGGTVLYTVDGVLASKRELAVFGAPVTSKETSKEQYYSPSGRSDGFTETTTTTDSLTIPADTD